jgi:hypothetical protein
LGERTSREAFERGYPVLIADLAGIGGWPPSRWPMFTAAVVEAGARAVFVLPLQLGAIRVGVLLLYRREPGELGSAALRNADTVTYALVDLLGPAPLARAGSDNGDGVELGAGVGVWARRGAGISLGGAPSHRDGPAATNSA